MLFENALYYPTIDIKDEAWLNPIRMSGRELSRRLVS